MDTQPQGLPVYTIHSDSPPAGLTTSFRNSNFPPHPSLLFVSVLQILAYTAPQILGGPDRLGLGSCKRCEGTPICGDKRWPQMLHSAPNEAWEHPAERCRDGPGVGVSAGVWGSFVREREGGERRVTEEKEKETGKREESERRRWTRAGGGGRVPIAVRLWMFSQVSPLLPGLNYYYPNNT